MKTVIQKWGNSLGVRIPKSVAQKGMLTEGTRVAVSEDKGHIIIRTVSNDTESLSDLLSNVTDTNLHTETQWNESQGKEIW